MKARQEAEYKTVDFFKNRGYPVTQICEILNISRSGYYKYKTRTKPKKEKQDKLLCSLIHEYYLTFDGILGYRRMIMFINKLNHKSFSGGYIHRLMNYLSITARIRRKKVNRKRIKPKYTKENILARDFTAKAPNEKRITDVTEFSIPEDSRKLQLSPIMDLYDSSIIEYELSFKNNNHLVFNMFNKARQNILMQAQYFIVIESSSIQEISLKVRLKKLE